jgi:site-specific DNA recombinase
MFATGTYRIMDIRDFLAGNGIVTRSGRPWPIDQVTKQVLTNPFYYGHFRFLGEIHEGVHKPIIAKKLFDAVQEVWHQRSRSWHEVRPIKPLIGLFRCGECGMMITAELQKGHIYYRCTKKSKIIECNQTYIRQEELDRQLSEMITTVSLRQDWAKKMLEKLEEEKVELAHSCGAFAQSKREEMKEISIKLQRLLDSYLDQDVDRDSYLNKKSELLSQKKTLEEQISRFLQTHHAWLEPMREWIIEAAGAANIARGKDLNAKKVLAQKIFGSNLILSDKKARGDALIPWAALRAAPPTRGWEPRMGIEPMTFPLPRECSAD